MRRLIVLALGSLLVLAGCGGSDNESNAAALSDVKVSDAKEPKITLDKGFAVKKTSVKVVKEGDGDEIAKNDTVKLSYVAVNGRTAKEIDNSYKVGQTLSATLKEGQILAGFIKGLEGQKVGSRVLVAIPPKDGFGAANEQLDLKKNDTMVFVFDVVAKVPQVASGSKKKLPGTVPSIKLDKDDHPAGFKPTAKTPKKVSEPAAYVAIQGDGAKVKKGQTVQVQYVGQVYPDGNVFDSSWTNGAPLSGSLGTGNFISCWDELIGQKVGSRVVLVCPSDSAYGDKGSGDKIKAGDSLIFAVDLLDAA